MLQKTTTYVNRTGDFSLSVNAWSSYICEYYSKIKTGQYIALDKVESICNALNCTPNDILVFLPDNPDNNSNNNKGVKSWII